MKQIARRHGYLASFMCRPALPNACRAAGICISRCSTAKAGATPSSSDTDELLVDRSAHFLAGLLAHARAAAAFTTPTINGYKRYRAYSMAPTAPSGAATIAAS